MTATHETPVEGAARWAIVELMGHKRLAGRISEVTEFGVAMIRIDVPGPDGTIVASPCYSGAALYGVTPCTEAAARREAGRTWNMPGPVQLALPAPREDGVDITEVDLDDEDGDGR